MTHHGMQAVKQEKRQLSNLRNGLVIVSAAPSGVSSSILKKMNCHHRNLFHLHLKHIDSKLFPNLLHSGDFTLACLISIISSYKFGSGHFRAGTTGTVASSFVFFILFKLSNGWMLNGLYIFVVFKGALLKW